MSRLIKGLASAAVLAGMGLAVQPASAAPFMTVSLLGRVQNGPFSSNPAPFTPSVALEPGQVLEYVVEYQLSPSGATNPFAGADVNTQTIHSWNASPNYGLNSMFFSLNQDPFTAGNQVSLNTQIIALTTGDEDLGENSSWTGGTGNNRGVVTMRGDGNNNLQTVRLFRSSGNFDGIGPAPSEGLELIRVARGLAPVTALGAPSQVEINLEGFPFDPNQPNPFIAAFKFRNALDTGDVIYTPTLSEQMASANAGDPIIVFNNLTLVPEPTTFGLLGTAGAIGLLARRRRVS